jgi:hypothetical protein
MVIRRRLHFKDSGRRANGVGGHRRRLTRLAVEERVKRFPPLGTVCSAGLKAQGLGFRV